ncbi:hypothetical protein [Pseudoxanthomonas winnipegensis]|uniref:Uncharacterized protein n=1 Tax=Pseudoxanthomonas winnipegensis TaxID=2480810 RepID=A0A4V2HFD7_9GAMM|nr:hypothetical protein [Pseudoxanthomonas winnipegensis]RZZ90634.1 hypothetical protein EA663_02450 [Pseudoxanthomonas winnipegensis]TAA37211.1 hypothetical protein EA656_00590 [Pseudoxanthomonas winnipegensis]
MSAPVAVLAVIDREIERAGGDSYSDGRDLIEVRAAVAGLITASRDAAAVLQSKAGPLEQETPRRLYAALARVGGAQ